MSLLLASGIAPGFRVAHRNGIEMDCRLENLHLEPDSESLYFEAFRSQFAAQIGAHTHSAHAHQQPPALSLGAAAASIPTQHVFESLDKWPANSGPSGSGAGQGSAAPSPASNESMLLSARDEDSAQLVYHSAILQIPLDPYNEVRASYSYRTLQSTDTVLLLCL